MRAERQILGRQWARERGSYAVEFALISPVLLVMLMGTVQLGFGLYTGSTVQYCVERVARSAMLDRNITSEQIQSKVNAALADQGSNISVTVHYTVDNSGAVPIAEISTTYPYPLQIPFLTVYNMTFTVDTDRKSTRLNSSHIQKSRMPSSA